MDSKGRALNYLFYLRKGDPNYESLLVQFRDAVKKGSLSLDDDLRTSEEELERLRIEGCMVVARQWFVRLCRGTLEEFESLRNSMFKEIEKGKNCFSFTDITTAEERQEFSLIELRWKQWKQTQMPAVHAKAS